jgi:hypothetical protein
VVGHSEPWFRGVIAAGLSEEQYVEIVSIVAHVIAVDRRFAGTVAGTAPSTAHQLRLNLSPNAPLRFMFEPLGYQLHVWREDGGLVSHTAVFGDWAGPYPFRAEATL